MISKYWVRSRPSAPRVVERVGEADAVDRVLRDAVDDARRRDADDLVDRRDDVVAVMELRARRRVRLDLRRPADRHRVARAAEVRGEQLRALVGRAARPAPAGVVLVVGLRRAEHVQAAELLERVDVLLGGGRNAVLRQQFADRAVLALGRGAVVAPDVEDQRVVAVARARSSSSTIRPTCTSTCSANPAATSIRRRWNGFSSSGMLVPRRHRLVPRR